MLRRASSILLAVVLHAALLALALWMLSRQEPAPEIRIGSVPVTIVSDVIREAAPTPAPSEELFEEVTPDASETSETEAPETPTPQPTSPRPTPPTPTPPRPTPPRPTPGPRPTPPRPDPTPPRPTPSRQSSDDFLSGLEGDRTPSRTGPSGRPATESGSGDAPAATGPQIAMFGRQVIPHWNLTFCQMAGGDDLTIRMTLTIDGRGRITEGPTLVSPQSGPVFRAASESAIRAVRAAAPFDVPDGFETRSVPFRFDTADACP